MMDWFRPAIRILNERVVQVKRKKIKLSVLVVQLVSPLNINI